MGSPSPRGTSSRLWPLRVMLGVLFALFVAAAPRIALIAELRTGTLTFFNKQEGWAVGRGPLLSRTIDGGRTWKEIKIRIDGTETNTEVRGTYFISAKTAWIGLRQSEDRLDMVPNLVVTRDGGRTWKLESLPNVEWFVDSLFADEDPRGPLWLGGQGPRRRRRAG